MKKNKNLIKRKNLEKIFKEEGLTRISPLVYKKFEDKISERTNHIAKVLAQKITIKGKKTLEKEDIEEVFEEEEKKTYPEI